MATKRRAVFMKNNANESNIDKEIFVKMFGPLLFQEDHTMYKISIEFHTG